MSHFCEHMMFKGTERFGPGAIMRIIQYNGGSANAYTTRDITVYHSIVPGAGLADIIDLEADRISNCLMDPAAVRTEKQVVLEEELMTGRDDPDGALDSALFQAAFSSHPYRYSISGSRDDIMAFSPAGVRRFYGNFYNPSNAVAAVVGKNVLGSVHEKLSETFGAITGRMRVKHFPAVESIIPGMKRTEIRHPSPLHRISIAFHVPPANHPDSPVLSLQAIHLASGRSSRLEELLVKPGIVLDIYALPNSLLHPGLFTIHAILAPGSPAEKVEEIIFKELGCIAGNSMEKQLLDRLKEQFRSRSIIKDANPGGRAGRFATGMGGFGDPFFFRNSIEQVGNIALEDVQRAAAQYLVPQNTTIARLVPSNGLFLPGKTMSQPPAPPLAINPVEIDVPLQPLPPAGSSISDDSEDIRLDNGLRLITKVDDSFPIVSIAFSCPMGTLVEPAGQAGLSEVTAELMLHGTEDEDSIRFNARIENRGSALCFSAAAEFASGNVTVLGKDLEHAISVVADLLIRPAFREEDMRSVIADSIAGLREWTGQPSGAALDSFARISTDPSCESGIPTVETLEALTRKDIITHHRNCCRPRGAVITAVGNFSGDEFSALAEKYFGGWKNLNLPILIPVARKNGKSSTEIKRLDGMEQTAIVLGAPAPSRQHPDYHAVMLINGILGAGACSRLEQGIRDSRGLAYYVGSFYTPSLSRGRIAAMLLTSPESYVESLELLEREFDRLVEKPVSEMELRFEKATCTGKQVRAQMNYSSIAGVLLAYASLGLSLDYDVKSLKQIAALTTGGLHEAAVHWFGKKTRYLAVAGPASICPATEKKCPRPG